MAATRSIVPIWILRAVARTRARIQALTHAQHDSVKIFVGVRCRLAGRDFSCCFTQFFLSISYSQNFKPRKKIIEIRKKEMNKKETHLQNKSNNKHHTPHDVHLHYTLLIGPKSDDCDALFSIFFPSLWFAVVVAVRNFQYHSQLFVIWYFIVIVTAVVWFIMIIIILLIALSLDLVAFMNTHTHTHTENIYLSLLFHTILSLHFVLSCDFCTEKL